MQAAASGDEAAGARRDPDTDPTVPIYRRPVLLVQFHDCHEPFVWLRLVPASGRGQPTIHHVREALILARRLKG